MKKIFVLIAAFVMIVATTAPASAHRLIVKHGDDRGKVFASHNRIRVVDNECDGNSVWFEYRGVRESGEIFSGRINNQNGCATGGVQVYFLDIKDFLAVRLCEDARNYDCTTWKNP